MAPVGRTTDATLLEPMTAARAVDFKPKRTAAFFQLTIRAAGVHLSLEIALKMFDLLDHITVGPSELNFSTWFVRDRYMI